MTTTLNTPPTTATTAAPATVGADPTARLLRVAAVLGPLFFVASSLAWVAGADYEELRGILTFWAMPFTALAAYGVAGRLQGRSPVGRAAVTALVTIGACAGAGFATEINMVDHFGVERLMDQDTPSAFLALGIPGPMFAVGLALLGLLSFRQRTLPSAQALCLALGGVLFPLGRIPQLPELALATDLLFLAALAPVALTRRSATEV